LHLRNLKFNSGSNYPKIFRRLSILDRAPLSDLELTKNQLDEFEDIMFGRKWKNRDDFFLLMARLKEFESIMGYTLGDYDKRKRAGVEKKYNEILKKGIVSTFDLAINPNFSGQVSQELIEKKVTQSESRENVNDAKDPKYINFGEVFESVTDSPLPTIPRSRSY
jgi:hypothetical protein